MLFSMRSFEFAKVCDVLRNQFCQRHHYKDTSNFHFFKVPSDSTVDREVCACADIMSINILASFYHMDQSKRQ
jgi:hypothetical protein